MPITTLVPSNNISIFIAIALRLGLLALAGSLIIYVIYLVIKPSVPMEQDSTASRVAALRSIYFYLASFVGLMMLIIAVASIVNIVLKATIFTKADSYTLPTPEEDCSPERLKEIPTVTLAQCQKMVEESRASRETNRAASRQNDLAFDIGLLAAGIPLFAYHFSVVQGLRRKMAKK